MATSSGRKASRTFTAPREPASSSNGTADSNGASLDTFQAVLATPPRQGPGERADDQSSRQATESDGSTDLTQEQQQAANDRLAERISGAEERPGAAGSEDSEEEGDSAAFRSPRVSRLEEVAGSPLGADPTGTQSQTRDDPREQQSPFDGDADDEQDVALPSTGRGATQDAIDARRGASQEGLDVISGLAGDVTNSRVSRNSLADDGDGGALASAIAEASKKSAQDEEARKAGVAPSGQTAGNPEPGPDFQGAEGEAEAPDDSDGPGEVEERGPLAALKEWLSGDRTFTGTITTKGASPSHDFTGVDVAGVDRVGTTTQAEAAKEVGVKNLETAVQTSLGTKAAGGAKLTGDPSNLDGDGPPTEARIAFSKYLREQLHYHDYGHNGDGSTDPADGDGSPRLPRSGISITSGIQHEESLLGNPGGAGAHPHADFSGGGPNPLPGDAGNVDPAPDDDGGAFTSTPLGGDPSDVDFSRGGGGLGIAPPEEDRRDADDDVDSGQRQRHLAVALQDFDDDD